MKIYEALSAINKQIEPIAKNRKNEQQNFKFRGIDDVMISLHDLFAEHEVFITTEIVHSERFEKINAKGTVLYYHLIDYRFTFTTTDGSSISTVVRGEAMDSGDKGSNKTISVALKYALFNMFLIPTEEQSKADPDATSHELKAEIPPTNQNPPQAAKKDMPVVTEWMSEETFNRIKQDLIAAELPFDVEAVVGEINNWKTAPKGMRPAYRNELLTIYKNKTNESN